jgi:Cdc6-like AAA superfamily ATPase
MQDNIYESSKNIFIDIVQVQDYIKLDRVTRVYQSLLYSLQKPLKMILIYGKPGTGKSMFLSKLHDELKHTQKIYMYLTPILDESEFVKILAQDLLDIPSSSALNFTQFMRELESAKKENENSENDNVPIILLDEVQLYSDSLMEKIRLLSDTRAVKFVLALHKTQGEDLLAKEHFQTRIWESIELENASVNELNIYITKKLLQYGYLYTFSMFDVSVIENIHSITHGNYRDTNKLLYSVFDIYDYYSKKNPEKISTNKISKDIIEMAAIHTGLLNA